MPEVSIMIGGRQFEVACQAGEEQYLHSAAKMLDDEAQVLADQTGRMPEARMLLMAGLMLADKAASMEDRVGEVQALLDERDAEIARLKAAPAAEPERVEVQVPVVPDGLAEALSALAEKSEGLAGQVEAQTGAV